MQYWSPVEIPTWIQFFSLINSSNLYTVWFLYEFIQTNSYNCYKNCIVRIRTRCGFCTNSYNFYTNCIVRIRTRCDFFILFFVFASCERAARAASGSVSRERAARATRGEAQAHLLPRPGRTRLSRLGYTRLSRPVRVRSWGDLVRNGIKVYNLYHRLPQLLGYTRLPRYEFVLQFAL